MRTSKSTDCRMPSSASSGCRASSPQHSEQVDGGARAEDIHARCWPPACRAHLDHGGEIELLHQVFKGDGGCAPAAGSAPAQYPPAAAPRLHRQPSGRGSPARWRGGISPPARPQSPLWLVYHKPRPAPASGRADAGSAEAPMRFPPRPRGLLAILLFVRLDLAAVNHFKLRLSLIVSHFRFELLTRSNTPQTPPTLLIRFHASGAARMRACPGPLPQCR